MITFAAFKIAFDTENLLKTSFLNIWILANYQFLNIEKQ